ncbi:MAG: SDR family NAD(P)-dependent oxidoreductase [Gemmatimonadales bacterium]
MTSASASLAIITGASSGIGAALANQLLAKNWDVIGLSRTPGPIHSPRFTHVAIDLAESGAIAGVLNAQVRHVLTNGSYSRLALVNNAADVALLGQVATLKAPGMMRAYAVNTVSPVILMGWMLEASPATLPLRIVNVSSGAAVEPVPGMGAYSATKAALRIAGMVLAAELDLRAGASGDARDVSIWSYEPGIVDTPMQAEVRSSTPESLPIVDVFRQLADNEQLTDPEIPAAEILRYVESDGHPRFSEQRFHFQ